MNIEKAKRLLAKMNVLVDHAGEGMSPLEQDLFKNYAHQLYQISGGSPDIQIEDKATQTAVESVVQEVLKPAQILVTPELISSEQEFIPTEIIEKADDSIITEDPENSEIELPETDVVEVQPESPAIIEEKVVKLQEAQELIEDPIMNQNGDGKLEALFEIKKGSDLLAKLSDKPLAKVEHGMVINEKIFTINELFGGDNQLFQTTVSALNEAENFEQAKNYLIGNVAKDQDWMAPEKMKKVEKFVQLVYRRFA